MYTSFAPIVLQRYRQEMGREAGQPRARHWGSPGKGSERRGYAAPAPGAGLGRLTGRGEKPPSRTQIEARCECLHSESPI